MKSVFILGAGMVSRPLVRYLLEKGYKVTIGDMHEAQAQSVIGGHRNGIGIRLDISQEDDVRRYVKVSDLVISLLPPKLHTSLARICLEEKKNFLTASYLSPEMKAMAKDVEEAGLIFLNEVGLDPGLDHMTAMEMIDDLTEEGYVIESFDSHCGGIPARAAANNPLRYKLSWSPAGVLGAITRDSRFRKDGKLMEIPGASKLEHMEVLHVPGAGIFESNPNQDSLYYGECYGLKDATTIRRGTLRYPGWAQFWLFMIRHGFNDATHKINFENKQVLDALFELNGKATPDDMFKWIHAEADEHASVFLERMESLGLLDPKNTVSGEKTCFDIMLMCMEATMQYAPGERDLVLMHHEMIGNKDGVREKWTSTIVREGNETDSAMAFLVGVPAAIAARLILEEKIQARGVLIPLTKEIYAPILAELVDCGLPHEVIKKVLN